MNKGDIIARKDMPQVKYRITGENKKHPDFWNVAVETPYPGLLKRGMIAKDDDRWEVFNG